MLQSINFSAPINNLSYGYSSYHILRELLRFTKVALFPIHEPQVPQEYDPYPVSSALQYAFKANSAAPSLRLWHQFDLAHHVGKGVHIGFPIFELNRFDNRELANLGLQDIIFVPSSWAKSIVLNSLDKHVEIIPLGVDRDIFNENVQAEGIESARLDNDTIFMNVGKLEVRKGHFELIECFNNAFSPKDHVQLWLCTYNVHYRNGENEKWMEQCKSTKMGERIHFFPRFNTQRELANLMQFADCGVFPSKAEGWNLDALEFLSMGKHLIITDYSAHKEFVTPENASLITITELEIAQDNHWFRGQGEWAKIGTSQKTELINLLKYHHSVRQNEGKKLNHAGIDTAVKFSWTNSACKIYSCLASM